MGPAWKGGILITKKDLRGLLAARRRKEDPGYSAEADRGICRALTELLVYREAGLIFSYVSVGDETDTAELIRRALAEGKRVAVPRCDKSRPGIMEACEIHSLEELRPGAFGIPEPGAFCPVTAPEEISLCIVPCVSVNPDTGARLGYGGGYYDRYLLRTGAVRAALCRERLLSREVPEEPHDVRMDLVVTEERVIRYRNFR